MATNAYIGIINYDKSVDLIYCHNDGYPSHQIPVLLEHYNTAEKVRELINLGNISCLYDNVKPESTRHSFDNPEPNTVIAYHRDRGENWNEVEPMHFKNKTEMMRNFYGSYVYLFDVNTSKWKYTSNKRFKVATFEP